MGEVRGGGVLDEDDEFVTANPGENVDGADQRGEAVRDGREDEVTVGVPEPVVDGFEPVEGRGLGRPRFCCCAGSAGSPG